MLLQTRKATDAEKQAFLIKRGSLRTPETLAKFRSKGEGWFSEYNKFCWSESRHQQITFDIALGYLWTPTQEQVFDNWFQDNFGNRPSPLENNRCKELAWLGWQACRESMTTPALPASLKRERDRVMNTRSKLPANEVSQEISLLRGADHV